MEGPSKIHRKHALMGFSRPIKAPSRILLDGDFCPADDVARPTKLVRALLIGIAISQRGAPHQPHGDRAASVCSDKCSSTVAGLLGQTGSARPRAAGDCRESREGQRHL